jgi:hypothetical protein
MRNLHTPLWDCFRYDVETSRDFGADRSSRLKISNDCLKNCHLRPWCLWARISRHCGFNAAEGGQKNSDWGNANGRAFGTRKAPRANRARLHWMFEQHGAGFREYDAKPAICTDQTRYEQGCSHRCRNTALEFSGYENCLASPEYPPVAPVPLPHGGPCA